MKDKNHSFRGSGDSESGDKALWDLLGKARKTEVSSMFSRNVLREVRLSNGKSSAWGWFFDVFRKPAFSIAAVAVLFLSCLIIIRNVPETSSVVTQNLNSEIEYIDPALEFNSIEMLGELMAVSDPGALSDEALMNLLF